MALSKELYAISDDLGLDFLEDQVIIDFDFPKVTEKYRMSSLGRCLQASLDQMKDKISDKLYNKIFSQFDRSMVHALANRARGTVVFKADKLTTYKRLDDTWQFVFDKVEFREFHNFAYVDKLMVEAVDNPVKKVHRSRKRKATLD